MDELGITVEFYKEQLSYCRHIETQRATMTNIVLVVAAVLLGVTFHDGQLVPQNWPFPTLLIIVGIFSYYFSMKHYERFKLHDGLSDQYRLLLERKCPETIVDRDAIYKELNNKFGFIHRQKLNAYWRGIPIAITILGIGSLLLILI